MADIKINANACVKCGHSQKDHADNHGCKADGCDCDRIGVY